MKYSVIYKNRIEQSANRKLIIILDSASYMRPKISPDRLVFNAEGLPFTGYLHDLDLYYIRCQSPLPQDF